MTSFNNDNAILDQFGLNDVNAAAPNPTYGVGTHTPVAAPKQNIIGDIGNSVMSAIPAAAKIIGDTFVQPIQKFAGTLSALGTGKEFKQSQDYQRESLDAQMKSLSKRYASTDPKVKISKEYYQKRIGEIEQQYADLGKQAGEYGQQLQSPLQAVESGAETLSTPFAAGKLAKGGLAAKAGFEAATAGDIAKTAAKAVIKNPLVTQPVVQTPFDVARDVKKGDLGGAAFNTALLASAALKGGPLGLLNKGAGLIGKGISKAVYGQESLFKNIKTSDGNLLGFVKRLEQKAAQGSESAKKDLETARIFQQYKLDETKGNVGSAVRELQQHFANLPTEERTGREVFNDFKKFVDSTLKVKAADEAGKIPRGPGQENLSARVGRFGVGEYNQLKTALNGVTDPGERFRVANEIANDSEWGKNPVVKENILTAVSKDDWNGKIPVNAIRQQGKVAGLSRGYFPILTKNARAELKPVSETAASFKETKPLLPGLRGILRKTGLSSEQADPTVFRRIEAATEKKINNIGISSIANQGEGSIGKQVTDRLLGMLEHKIGATDIRQLGVKDIATELGITVDQARKVRNSVHEGHLAVSLGERGLGSRIQDLNLKFNPLAAPYSRIQGALKYELNPFFRAQTNIETETLGQGLAPNLKGLQRLFGRSDSQQALQHLREAGVLKGERAAQGAGGGPYVSAKLTSRQQRILAGTAEALAENRGISLPELLQDHKVRDELRAIVQYPENGIFSSNLAKTANLVFFPVSYNFKVASLAAKALARQSPVVQIATIKAVNDFNDWLDTDDGIKWTSKNSEAIGLLHYFTPENSIESVMQILKGKGNTASFGLVGGLPFGLISQIMQDHGLFTTDSPYADPKTGQVVPDKIPADLKASAAVTITDILNSMYNFPGRIVGLPSKKDVTQSIPGLKGLAQNGTYTERTRTDLTPRQQRAQQILASPASKQTQSQPSKLNAPKIPNVKVVPQPGKARGRRKYYARPLP